MLLRSVSPFCHAFHVQCCFHLYSMNSKRVLASCHLIFVCLMLRTCQIFPTLPLHGSFLDASSILCLILQAYFWFCSVISAHWSNLFSKKSLAALKLFLIQSHLSKMESNLDSDCSDSLWQKYGNTVLQN